MAYRRRAPFDAGDPAAPIGGGDDVHQRGGLQPVLDDLGVPVVDHAQPVHDRLARPVRLVGH